MANEFLPFAIGASANVLTPAEYAALASIVSDGFQSGILASERLNVVLRQATFVAAAMAQIIDDNSVDAVDDGDMSTFVTNFLNAVSAKISVGGYGQTWQDVAASRAIGTTYTNSTGRPIAVAATMLSTTGGASPQITINGTIIFYGTGQATANNGMTVFAIVPNGATYAVWTSATATLSSWKELR